MNRRLFHRAAGSAGLAALAACSLSPPVPDAGSVAGRRPSGTVRLEEAFVSGAGVGRGTLHFQGRSHAFRMAGSILGPGGAARLRAHGDVYNLTRLQDFAGLYSQGTGRIGIDTSSAENLWLQNAAGVIMHLRGERQGVIVSLGRDELLVEFLP